jgi:2-C-methyl-D-erythritol 2,4-cyclodiphosphate synthase
MNGMNFRVGFGYDVHRLEEGYPLMIGGIEIPFEKGSKGHSDGDVLIHALMDALLGAAAKRDIGYYFPDNDPLLKGIDSKLLLERTMKMLNSDGYLIGNIDATVSLQEPKIGYAIPEMQKILSQILNVAPDALSIKATTTEKLGFVGHGEGVAAYCVVLIYKENR